MEDQTVAFVGVGERVWGGAILPEGNGSRRLVGTKEFFFSFSSWSDKSFS
jgi:hypothetical protein